MSIGSYGAADVPKKAIGFRDIVMHMSSLMSIAKKSNIPIINSSTTLVKRDITVGQPGYIDKTLSGVRDDIKLEYKPIYRNMEYPKYPFCILDESKLNNADARNENMRNLNSSNAFFSAALDYNLLTELKACYANTAAATETWTTSETAIEEDIVTAISVINDKTNLVPGQPVNVVYPAACSARFKSLTLVNNIQTSIEDHLSRSLKINLIPYRPMRQDSSTLLFDGLGNDALIYVGGSETAEMHLLDPRFAQSVNVPLIERMREFGRGDKYLQRAGMLTMATWDGYETYSATAGATSKIYKVTAVKS